MPTNYDDLSPHEHLVAAHHDLGAIVLNYGGPDDLYDQVRTAFNHLNAALNHGGANDLDAAIDAARNHDGASQQHFASTNDGTALYICVHDDGREHIIVGQCPDACDDGGTSGIDTAARFA